MERTLRLMCNTRNVENAAAFLDDAGYVPCFAVFYMVLFCCTVYITQFCLTRCRNYLSS